MLTGAPSARLLPQKSSPRPRAKLSSNGGRAPEVPDRSVVSSRAKTNQHRETFESDAISCILQRGTSRTNAGFFRNG